MRSQKLIPVLYEDVVLGVDKQCGALQFSGVKVEEFEVIVWPCISFFDRSVEKGTIDLHFDVVVE